MPDVTVQLSIVFGVLAACFIGPALAIAFLLWRKAGVRARRRSPISIELLRAPGHSLREELDAASYDQTWDIALLMVMPLVILTLFLAQGHVMGLERVRPLWPAYALFALGFVTFLVQRLWRAAQKLDNLKAGLDAEVAVGQELDQLMRHGAVVFHDFPADKFNIDHVVIAREGVFAVETKGYTKLNQGRGKADATVVFDGQTLKFPSWTTREPLEQAARQADWLAKWASSATGSTMQVMPVLALPGWFVERSGRGVVRVFSGRELSGLLKSRGTQGLSEQDIERVAHQIEQRCRTVVPKYTGEVKNK